MVPLVYQDPTPIALPFGGIGGQTPTNPTGPSLSGGEKALNEEDPESSDFCDEACPFECNDDGTCPGGVTTPPKGPSGGGGGGLKSCTGDEDCKWETVNTHCSTTKYCVLPTSGEGHTCPPDKPVYDPIINACVVNTMTCQPGMHYNIGRGECIANADPTVCEALGKAYSPSLLECVDKTTPPPVTNPPAEQCTGPNYVQCHKDALTDPYFRTTDKGCDPGDTQMEINNPGDHVTCHDSAGNLICGDVNCRSGFGSGNPGATCLNPAQTYDPTLDKCVDPITKTGNTGKNMGNALALQSAALLTEGLADAIRNVVATGKWNADGSAFVFDQSLMAGYAEKYGITVSQFFGGVAAVMRSLQSSYIEPIGDNAIVRAVLDRVNTVTRRTELVITDPCIDPINAILLGPNVCPQTVKMQ